MARKPSRRRVPCARERRGETSSAAVAAMNSRRFIRSSSQLEDDGTQSITSRWWSHSLRFAFLRPSPIFAPCANPRSNPASRPAGTKVPDRPEWLHEIKHDGYRLIVQREGKRVRLLTRNGHDWSGRYPLIVGGRAAQPEQLVRDRRRSRAARRRRPLRFQRPALAQARCTRSSSTPSTSW